MTIAEIIALPEGSTLDFKRDLSSLDGVVKTIAAMSNTANSMMVIGVDDDKTVRGLADPLADEERLARAVADSVDPLLLIDIRHASIDAGALLIVDVPFTPRPFYIKSEGFPDGVYIREGSTNTKADEATVQELRRQAAAVSYDLETVPSIDAKDLDAHRLRAAFGRKPTVAKLKTLGLADDQAGRSVATRAGVILFGADEQRRRHHPDARIRAAAFKGTTMVDFLDQGNEFDGTTVLEALDLVDAFIERNTRDGASIGGALRRINIKEYAPRALRELLVNAVAHANYASAGTPISVALFSDRLEISSPGRFPPGTTVGSLKDGMSKIRNRGIANTLHFLDIMETWGSGWARIQATFDEGYPEPEWKETAGSVKVILPVHPHFGVRDVRDVGEGHEEAKVRVRRDRRAEITAVLGDEPLSAEEISEQISLSVRQVQRYLRLMEDEGTVAADSTKLTDPTRRYRPA